MTGENFILFGIVAAAFLISLFVTYLMGKSRHKLGLTITALLWSGFTGILFFGMYNANGWDAIGYLAFLIGVSAPAGVGGLIGGLVGWAKGGNEQLTKPTDGAGATDV